MIKSEENQRDIIIRLFDPVDYEQVLQVWSEAGLPYKANGRDRREKMIPEMARKTAALLVAEDKGRMAGTVLATHDGRKGWINRLAVLPAYRNRGLARRLVEEAEKILRERGMEIIACLIEAGNAPSLALFTSAGYIRDDHIVYLSKRDHQDV